MNNALRLLLTSLFMSAALMACGEKENTTSEAETPAANVEVIAETPSIDITISTDMSEADVIAKLGEPSYTETRQLDALKITHSEWTNERGTKSVQFHNDMAAFSQFVPATTE